MKLKLDKGTDPGFVEWSTRYSGLSTSNCKLRVRRIVDEAKSNMDAGAPPTNPDDKELSKRSGSPV